MCLAFDADSLDDVGRRLGDVLEMQPPQGLAEKVRGLKKLKSIADSQPKSVRSGPVQEVVLTGDEVDLGPLPVQTCWPGDAAPFITLPAVITADPRTGGRNVGMYRLQVLDRRTTAMHWQIHKDGRADYLLADGKLEVAVALGLDPVTATRERAAPEARRRTHARRLPARRAGRARARQDGRPRGAGERRDRARGLPRQGRADRGRPVRRPHRLLHAARAVPGLSRDRDDDAARRDYPSIVVGKPPQEDAWLGKATERIFLPAIRMSVPEIVDYDLPVAAPSTTAASSRSARLPGPRAEGDARDLGARAAQPDQAVVVVDEWVDVHDYEEVFFRVGANVDPKRDVLISEGPLDHLDHAPTLQFYGGKLGSTRRTRARRRTRASGRRRSR